MNEFLWWHVGQSYSTREAQATNRLKIRLRSEVGGVPALEQITTDLITASRVLLSASDFSQGTRPGLAGASAQGVTRTLGVLPECGLPRGRSPTLRTVDWARESNERENWIRRIG